MAVGEHRAARSGARTGAQLIADSLAALGDPPVFGVPGVHALPIWDALKGGGSRVIGNRTELASAFAADGYARSTGKPAVVLVSTGPGALNSLTGVMEAASSHVPIVVISSQVPSSLLGAGRGYLHDLADQAASFRPVVKAAERAVRAEDIPALIGAAWRTAVEAPSGPAYVEIPVDLLRERVDGAGIPTGGLEAPRPIPLEPDLDRAATLLAEAERPVIWAGGGAQRSGASAQLLKLAERLAAPVATTFMGKGAIPDSHPLALGSGCDEGVVRELLEDADVLLCVGTELGAETTSQYELAPRGRLIQIDAAAERIGRTYPALGLIGDAAATLDALDARLPASAPDERRVAAERRVEEARGRIAAGLDAQDVGLERRLLATVGEALGPDGIASFDMTILGYWAAAHLDLERPRSFLYPLGSGTLGYSWPAAIGAAIGGRRVLAVSGDGGVLYAITELAVARQHELDVTLLIVDDGGYGVLREYQQADFGATTAVELERPDFVALAESFSVPARRSSPERLGEDLRWGLASPGPTVIVLEALLATAAATD